MPFAIQFDEYGSVDVLQLRDVPDALPGSGEVLVAVYSAGLNPGEIAIREGAMAEMFPTTFPSGQGSDFAGTVTMVGEGATDIRAGDDVIGMSDERGAQRQNVTIAADHVVRKPEGLEWELAGALGVSATTAWACVEAVQAHSGDVVVVAGAAGGVGIVAAQLAKLRGATVYGTASVANHGALARLGIEPVLYGDDLGDRLPEHIDAFIDCHGGGNVAVAIAKGVDPARVNTIIDFDAVDRYGIRADGQASVTNHREVIAEVADHIAAGRIELPIRKKYAFEQYREAYEELANGHGLGKVVLWLGVSD